MATSPDKLIPAKVSPAGNLSAAMPPADSVFYTEPPGGGLLTDAGASESRAIVDGTAAPAAEEKPIRRTAAGRPPRHRERFSRVRRLLLDQPPAPSVLDSLFERESPVWSADLEKALSASDIGSLVDLNLIRLIQDRFVPRVRIDRIDGLVVASDLRLRFLQPDFVAGLAPGGILLARFIRPAVGGTALDLGCGSGVLSLLLAAQGSVVEGVDINLRAVGFARFNIALNDLATIRAHYGDFLAEDADRRHDAAFTTVVANPPYVLAPELRLVYRDRPLPGDRVGARTVERVTRSLVPGGRGYVLCNWIDPGNGHWSGAVRRWLDGRESDALVIRVADQGPAEYAMAWNRYLEKPDRDDVVRMWTQSLQREGVKRIHSGVIAVGRHSPSAGTKPRFAHVDARDQAVSWQTVEEFLES